jgi:DNA-binding CsgD family transcriptional regulator
MVDIMIIGQELTSRERQIVALVGEGLTNSEIGERLHLSPLTIKTHLSRIFQKTGAKSRANVVLLAEQRGRFRSPIEIAVMLQQLRADRSGADHLIGTADWYRQEGELRVLDRLITQIAAVTEPVLTEQQITKFVHVPTLFQPTEEPPA